MYIAHIREHDDVKQSVREHLLECQRLAESYGESVGLKHLTGLGGLLHDAGKYSDEFRSYLTTAVYDPENAGKRGSVDHSTAGGKILYELYHKDKTRPFHQLVSEVVGNAIISHHSSLQDFTNDQLESSYIRRVDEKEVSEFTDVKQRFFAEVMTEAELDHYVEKAADEVKQFLSKYPQAVASQQLFFLTRIVFSGLIDADRTNTRQFEDQKQEGGLDVQQLFAVYDEKLEEKLASFKQSGVPSPINLLRQSMSDRCAEAALLPSDLFTLSIPTGGGKTLASLRYALKHARTYNKKRIIYIVPFTTIIEQNASEVSGILQDWTNVIEHHSNVVEMEEMAEDENAEGLYTTKEKIKLAKDNWDAPVIFTTMVQFLEAFYGHGSRAARRLHRLTEAVLIFDEVQKVPTHSVALFNQALNFLKTTGKSSMLLCTATQPALDFIESKLEIPPGNELVPDLNLVEKAFKRVELIDYTINGPFDTHAAADFVSEKMQEETSVLVILNTKTVVKKLYLELRERHSEMKIYHLSTSMCAAHRKETLDEIRRKLENDEPVVCVTTQLIEAGVDVDFSCVVRSLAGLDSIAQAAGRCNRHGKKELKPVYLIDHQEESLSRLDDIACGKEITKRMLRAMQKDPDLFEGELLSSKAMSRYFKEFYTAQESKLTYPVDSLGTSLSTILFAGRKDHPFVKQLLSQRRETPKTFIVSSFMLASKAYNVIDKGGTTILVPYNDEAKEIIATLNGSQRIEDLSRLLKKAQQYTVNVLRGEFNDLSKQGLLVSYLEGMVFAGTDYSYNEEFGLDVKGEGVSGGSYMF